MAVGIRVVGAGLQSDQPRELFSVSPIRSNLGSPYDITKGDRFLVLQLSAEQGLPPLTVVTDWQARLKK